MYQIRPGVFETNSSSTHSICIVTDRSEPDKLPRGTTLTFALGEFGWEHDRLDTPRRKASYLYAAILSLYDRKDVAKITGAIMDMLHSEDIDCDFEEPTYRDYGYGAYCADANIDHADSGQLKEFVDGTVRSKGRLLRYLFSGKSFVLTGNDNDPDDRTVDIHVDYPHEEYYKGN